MMSRKTNTLERDTPAVIGRTTDAFEVFENAANW